MQGCCITCEFYEFVRTLVLSDFLKHQEINKKCLLFEFHILVVFIRFDI